MTRRLFALFLIAHVAGWTAIAAWTQPNQPLDMVEMMYWGHDLQWGYYKHPPLPAWIAEVVSRATLGSVWPLYLVSQLAVATTFWAAWRLAKELLPPWPALCAAVLLDASAAYNLTTADLNHSIIVQPLWALSVLWLYRALVTGQLRYWAATGVCLGLGMLTKYDIATLVVAMLALPLINPRARQALRTAGPYVTLAASLLLFAPHVAWMVNHDFVTVRYAFFRGVNRRSWLGHIANPIEFLLSQSLAQLPMALLAWPLWRRLPRLALATGRERLDRDFLLVVCFGPFLLDLTISFCSGVKLQSMWGAPMWTFSGLFLLWSLPAVESRVYRTVARRCVLAGCAIAMAFVCRNTVLPHVRAKVSRVHYPGPQLAQQVLERWQQHTDQPLAIVAGPWWPAANVGLNAPGRIEVYDLANPATSPWSSDAELLARGGVILWEPDDEEWLEGQSVTDRLPEAMLLEPFEIDYQTSAQVPPARFRMAIVLPRGESADIAQSPTPEKRSGIILTGTAQPR